VDKIFMARTNLNRDNMTRNTSRKGDLTRRANSPILRHKQRAAACNALDRAQEASTTAVLGVRCHLNRSRHPREFPSLRDNSIIRSKRELEDGHGGTKNAVLHL
jgi:hypothetical protein